MRTAAKCVSGGAPNPEIKMRFPGDGSGFEQELDNLYLLIAGMILEEQTNGECAPFEIQRRSFLHCLDICQTRPGGLMGAA